jgi:hypothetical protein
MLFHFIRRACKDRNLCRCYIGFTTDLYRIYIAHIQKISLVGGVFAGSSTSSHLIHLIPLGPTLYTPAVPARLHERAQARRETQPFRLL